MIIKETHGASEEIGEAPFASFSFWETNICGAIASQVLQTD